MNSFSRYAHTKMLPSQLLCVVLAFVSTTWAQNYKTCDYLQSLTVGRSFDVFSPNYGSNRPYPQGTMCRWRATSPAGTRITVTCTDIRLPYSQSCTGDRIEISYSGNPTLGDAKRYCINTSFSQDTTSNQVVIALKSAPIVGNGGYFRCQLTAKAIAAVKPPATQAPITNVGQCGRRKMSRIIGGSATIVNEFPMMAGLIEGKNPVIFCGAVIVSPFNAVSAAHCFNRKVASNLQLLVGEHDYGTGSDTSWSKLYALQSILNHPSYSATTDLNDIAIVQVKLKIQYNVAVGPVCIPSGNDQLLGQYVEAVGWGTTSFGGKPSTVLQKASLSVISYAQCQQYYGTKIAYSHLCTLTPSRDACQMDSGGPMFLQSGGLVYLAGLISFGTGCAEGKPGVSTRITYYADWIRLNIH